MAHRVRPLQSSGRSQFPKAQRLGHVEGTTDGLASGADVREACNPPLTCAFELERVTGIEPA